VTHIVQFVLDLFGMSKREQFVTMTGMMVLMFALYAGKPFATRKVYSTLYLLLALSFCVFITTDVERTRVAAGIGLCAAVAALFGWYFVTDSRARRRRRRREDE
jgi:hypothetical protein